MAGFIVEYLADFAFSYTTTFGTYFAGSYIDLLFTISMFMMSVGTILLDPTPNKKAMQTKLQPAIAPLVQPPAEVK